MQVDCLLYISIGGKGSQVAVDAIRFSNGSPQHVGRMQVYLRGTGQIGPEILELDEIDFVGSAIFLSEAGTTGTIQGPLMQTVQESYARAVIIGTKPDKLYQGNRQAILLIDRFRYRFLFKRLPLGHSKQAQVQGRDTFNFSNSLTQTGAECARPKDGDRFVLLVLLTPEADSLTIRANAYDSGGFIKNGLVK
jgi:hypothetical protein